MILEQSQYAKKLLRDYFIDQAISVYTPIDKYTDIESLRPNKIRVYQRDYQQRVESLIYFIICTRFDLTFAISKLSQFYTNLTIRYMNALNRVLKYIRDITYFRLRYQAIGDSIEYLDIVYDNDKQDRKSIYRFALLYK